MTYGDEDMFSGSERDILGSDPALVPSFVRARGGVRVVFATTGERTQAVRRAESGGYRVRFPRGANPCEAVLINTGGGMAGGDHMTIDLALGAKAAVVATTQAAEKIYRSQGAPTEIDVSLRLDTGSKLDWLPQETILFSGSRWRRRMAIDLASDASLLMAESTVFGRLAMQEQMAFGLVQDRWRIRRAGQLVFAEDVRLDGHIAELLSAKASGAGANAFATILHIADTAERRLEEARDLLADVRSECGASAWGGMLVMRFLSRDPQALREDLVGVIEKFRHAPMPRSW